MPGLRFGSWLERSVLRRFAVAGCLALTFGLLGPAQVSGRQAEVKRLALVITNPAAGTDVAPSAEAISRKLGALGFEVVPAPSATLFDLVRATARLEDRVSGDTIVVVYYSGYAARANGEDWLIPAGATPAGPADLGNQALPLRATIRALRDKGAVVAAVIDGCRQSRVLEALGGACAGDPDGRERDIYQVSSSMRLVPGDLTSRLLGLLVEDRSVGQLFGDIQSNFGAQVVVETPAAPGTRAALSMSRPRPAPPPAPVPNAAPPPTVARAPAPPPPTAIPLGEYLEDAIARADYGDRDGARARAAAAPTIYGATIEQLSERDRLFVRAHISYINGDFAASARDFEASRAIEASGGAAALSGGAEARRSRLQGSAYLQLGRYKEAIGLLEQSARLYRQVMAADEERSALLLGPVWTRLGEAYRLDGRLGDARRTLEDAVRTQSGPAKGGAFLQMARLSYDEGNWDAAEGFGRNAAVDLGKASAKAGVADAYAAVGRAIYKKRPEAEGEAWRYYDLALEYDPQSASARAFAAELPARLVLPAFDSMRPRFTFNRTIESRALSCYPTAVERDAYLEQVKAEMDALYRYGIAINDYIARLWTLLSNYERRGYLEDYQDVLRGRGYSYRTAITQEEAGWKARREAVLARHAALTQWHGHAGKAAIPCAAEGPGRLAEPPGYQRNLPARDDYVATVSPSTPAPAPAPQPPASPARLPEPPPVSTAVVSPQPPAAVAPTPRPTAMAALTTSGAPLLSAAPPPARAEPPATVPSVSPPAAAAPLKPAVQTSSPAVAATAPVVTAPAPPPLVQGAVSPPKPAASTAGPQVAQAAAPAAKAVTPEPQPPVAPPPKPAPEKPAPPPEPKPAPPAVTTLAAAAPPRAPASVGPPVAPPPTTVAPAAAAAAPPAAAAYVTPPPILFVSAPATLPAAPPPPAPVKGKAAAPKPTPAATAKLALDRAAALVAQGRYDLAEREFAVAAESDPASTDARAGVLGARGLARLQAGQVALAMDDLNASRAIKATPEVLEALGRIYSANGNRGAAIDYYAEAVSLRPGYAQALFGRAEALRERGTPLRDEAELRSAEADYKAALAVKADVPEAHIGLAMTRFALGDFTGAVEGADAALRVRPIFPEAKYVRARARLELGQHQEALKDLVDLPAAFDVYARACSTGMAFSALADAALTAKDEPRAIELYGQAAQAFQPAVAARPGDPRSKFWSDVSSQNAIPGLIGKASRTKQMGYIRLRAGRKGPSPTATLVYADACKRT